MPEWCGGVRADGRLRGGDASRGLLREVQGLLVQRYGARVTHRLERGQPGAEVRGRCHHYHQARVLRALR